MRPLSLLLASIAVLVAVADSASLPGVTLTSASQGAANAAAVVIADPDGGDPKTVCVRFSESSITGKQLLDRAAQQRPDIDPVYARFGERGHAVCALCDVGCDASDCFCQSRYWNYNVARDGAWVRSGLGVDQRTVEHGDVDGWAFGGDGAAPPYIAFETICGAQQQPSPQPSPTPESTPTTAPSTSASPSAEPSPSSATTRAPTETAAPTPAPTSPPATPSPAPSTAPSASPSAPDLTTGPEPVATPTPTAQAGSPVPTPPEGGDDAPASGVAGTVAFLAVLGALIGLALWRRRGIRG